MPPGVRVVFLMLVVSGVLWAEGPAPAQGPTRLHINSGTLDTSKGVPLALHGVDALIAPGGDGQKMGGKLVQLRAGTVGLSYDSIAKLLNGKMKNSKVKDLKVSSDKGEIKINGKVQKVIELPFEVKGPVSVTPDGKLDLHASTEKAAKIPISGVADALGLNMQKMVGKGHKGIDAEKQDIIFDPDQLWGLPIHGQLTAARVESHELLLTFGHPASPPRRGGHTQTASNRKH